MAKARRFKTRHPRAPQNLLRDPDDLRAVLYARVSSERQADEGWSIPAQVKDLRRYAEERGFEVVREFTGPESASSPGREQFGEMVDFLRKKSSPKILLAEKTDRLTRNLHDDVFIEDLRLNQGVEVHLVKEGNILAPNCDPSALMQFDIMAAVARNQTRRHAAEVKKGLREAFEQGGWLGPAPYGWQNHREGKRAQLIPHPEESKIVLELFELYGTTGATLRDLESIARTRGWKGKRGGALLRSAIANTLKDPVHAGMTRWKGEARDGAHEALVDGELFDRVQAKLDGGRARPATSPPQRAGELFTGLLTCGHCGCSVQTYKVEKPSGKRYVYYRCSNGKGACTRAMLKESAVDEQVVRLLKRLVFPESVVESLRASIKHATKNQRQVGRELVAQLREKETRLQGRLDQAMERLFDGEMRQADYDRLTTKWRAEIDELRTQVEQHDRATWDNVGDALELLSLIRRAPELYAGAPTVRKRRIFGAVLSNSVIRDGRLEAEFRQPFTYVALAAAEERKAAAAGGEASRLVERSGHELDS